jgi:hypothetical protein
MIPLGDIKSGLPGASSFSDGGLNGYFQRVLISGFDVYGSLNALKVGFGLDYFFGLKADSDPPIRPI